MAGKLGSAWDPALRPLAPCLLGRVSAPSWASALTSCISPRPPPPCPFVFFLSLICLPVSLSLIESLTHLYRREARGGRGLGSQKDTSPAVSDPRWTHGGHLRI